MTKVLSLFIFLSALSPMSAFAQPYSRQEILKCVRAMDRVDGFDYASKRTAINGPFTIVPYVKNRYNPLQSTKHGFLIMNNDRAYRCEVGDLKATGERLRQQQSCHGLNSRNLLIECKLPSADKLL